jgi:hypothetical protein
MVMTDTQRKWLYVFAAAVVGGAGPFLLKRVLASRPPRRQVEAAPAPAARTIGSR